ncbi:MAG: transposase, partial [Moorea sp. SIO3I7]|nr:transposase [Moorena sp. SIO3I7]
SASRRKHRESNVWQRRFWEHTIRNDHDLHRHIDYIHYNPVKHGLVSCPHLWQYSSFHKWVERGKYRPDWGCCCGSNLPQVLDFSDLEDFAGE